MFPENDGALDQQLRTPHHHKHHRHHRSRLESDQRAASAGTVPSDHMFPDDSALDPQLITPSANPPIKLPDSADLDDVSLANPSTADDVASLINPSALTDSMAVDAASGSLVTSAFSR